MGLEDIHEIEKRTNVQIRRVKESKLSERSKEILLRFHGECIAMGLSPVRSLSYLLKIWKLANFSQKDLDRLGKEDIMKFMSGIESGSYHVNCKGGRSGKYSEHTKQSYRMSVKKFFQWLRGHGWKSKQYPEEVSWIIVKKGNGRKKLPEEILTDTEIMEMVKIAGNPRNRAFIGVLYESGCRIGELLTRRLKHVEFDDYGAVLRVHGKTGSRRVRIILFQQHLRAWLDDHPAKGDQEAPMWISISTRNYGEPLSYPVSRKLLKQTAKKAGIKKPLSSKWFRDARATHLASKLSEAVRCEVFGWVQGSSVSRVYTHLSGANIDNELLGLYGLRSKTEDGLKLKTCQWCDTQNPPEREKCLKCSILLDPITQSNYAEKKRNLLAQASMPKEEFNRRVEETLSRLLKERGQAQ